MRNNLFVFVIIIISVSILFADINNDFDEAMDIYRNQDFINAASLFKNIRDTYSAGLKYETALYYLAQSYEYSGNNELAAKNYKLFYEYYPNSVFNSIAKESFEYLKEYVDLSIFEDESNEEIETEKEIESDSKEINKQIPKSYVVQENETLWDIAEKLFGDGRKYQLLVEINELEDILDLKPGDILYTDVFDLLDDEHGGKVSIEPKSAAVVSDPELIPEKSIDKYNLANHHFLKQEYDKAINLYLEYLNLSSPEEKNYEKALFNLALSYNIIKDAQNSAKYFEHYVEKFKLGDKIKQVYFNLGRLYHDVLNDKSKSKHYFDKVMTFLPEDHLNESSANYLKLIGQSMAESRTLSETVKIEEMEYISDLKLTNSKPDEEESLLEQIEYHKQKAELNFLQPRLDIQDGLDKEKDSFDLRLNVQPVKTVAEEYEHLGQIQKESKVFLNPIREIEKSPEKINFDQRIQNQDENYFIKKGYETALKGMYAEAIKYYQDAIKYFPHSSTAYNNLAFLYAELGFNLEEAKNLVYKAINMSPEKKGHYLDTLGWIYYKEGDFLRAKELIEEGIFYNETPLKRYHLAKILLKLSKNDLAYENFKRAIIIQPESSLASKIKLEIRRLE